MNKNEIRIFICAHSNFDKLPVKSDIYNIAAQNMNIRSVNNLPVIYMNDEFTENHTVSCGEWCQLHYVYKNQFLIDDLKYVGFCHYRRIFEFGDNIDTVKNILDSGKAICLKMDWITEKENRGDNRLRIVEDHSADYIDLMANAIIHTHPEMEQSYNLMLSQPYLYCCNMFIMAKDKFIKLAKFIDDVYNDIVKHNDTGGDLAAKLYVKHMWYNKRIGHMGMWHGIDWQYRLYGFLIERLTHTFLLNEYGEDNLYITNFI